MQPFHLLLTLKNNYMNHFLQTGVYTEGCIIPVTIEDPSLLVQLDDFSESFRVNIYIGSTWVDCVSMDNYRQICNGVSSLSVYSRHNEYMGSLWTLIQEQLFYAYARIHGSL